MARITNITERQLLLYGSTLKDIFSDMLSLRRLSQWFLPIIISKVYVILTSMLVDKISGEDERLRAKQRGKERDGKTMIQ